MGEPIPPDQLRAVGERIDVLLDASGAGGVVARERAEELVRLVADLYGAGLERILEIMYDAGRLDDEVLAALAADDLVASLLLVHGLHPYDVTTRVEQALEGVRPYLGSHGGDVELLDVSEGGVVRLRLLGSCDGCPSSSVTLKLAVEGAIEAAAPEITSIEVEDAPAEPASDGLISVDALWSRVTPAAEGPGRRLAPAVGDRRPGRRRGGHAWTWPGPRSWSAGSDPTCSPTSTGAPGARARSRAPRWRGASARAVGEAVLRCPGCRAHYDVRRAGACLDDEALHLSPLPLLTTNGTSQVAVTAGVPA